MQIYLNLKYWILKLFIDIQWLRLVESLTFKEFRNRITSKKFKYVVVGGLYNQTYESRADAAPIITAICI